MSNVKWTDEQKQAIYEKNTNILVAAAAGSGKRNCGGDERKRPDFLGWEGVVRTRRQKNRNFWKKHLIFSADLL